MYKQVLQQIANSLYINIQHVNNIGLLNGTTGCCIFLYQYARYSKNSQYSDLADELLETIYDQLTVDLSLDFSNGLTGIAWTINYLVLNNYIELAEDELEEVNAVIYNMETKQFPADLQTEISLFSKGLYALHRTGDKDFLLRILLEVDDFLISYEDHNIPLSYLNSLIYLF
ncbi:MAG: hypothetical protein LUH15_05055 [Tannerellaceae bacterium]|nr:hypothetical protein [Tannerellaceae bacterium]